jgi:Holliday junction resolvase RusA-like endonuclease
MIFVDIKPMSVNSAWQGKRFKAPAYKVFEKECLYKLPTGKITNTAGKIKLVLVFGFSNKLQDIDGPTKPVIDILQKKYGFNDNQIYLLEVRKNIVKKGEEYWAFEITPID